jgi:hypothetical protein
MRKALTLPAGLTLETLNSVNKPTLDSSGRKWLKALQLALTRRYTAEAIARKVGRSRPWLFVRRDALYRGGLAASLTQQHGGGKKSRFSASVKQEMKKWFRSGDSPAEVHDRLMKTKKGINATIAQVYHLRQKWGLAQKQTGRRRRKKPTAPRPDALRVNVDETTMDLIPFILHSSFGVTDPGIGPTKLGILWILGWRGRILNKVAKGEISRAEAEALIPSSRTIASNLACSLTLVYRVARLWNQAQSKWGAFLELTFPSVSRRIIRHGIRTATEAFLKESPRPKRSDTIRIAIFQSRSVRFQNGKFSKED